MNIDKEIEKTKERCESECKLLHSLRPVSAEVEFVSNGSVFFKYRTYENNCDLLHLLRKIFGNYKMCHYYINGSRVACQYEFKNFNAQLFYTDNDFAVGMLSNGKCRIETQTMTQKYVKCEVA